MLGIENRSNVQQTNKKMLSLFIDETSNWKMLNLKDFCESFAIVIRTNTWVALKYGVNK